MPLSNGVTPNKPLHLSIKMLLLSRNLHPLLSMLVLNAYDSLTRMIMGVWQGRSWLSRASCVHSHSYLVVHTIAGKMTSRTSKR